MIIVTELGDKTFFIAAVLAMRDDRLMIFGGAIGACVLVLMCFGGGDGERGRMGAVRVYV